MSEKMGKVNGLTTEYNGVLMNAVMTLLISLVIAFVFSWQVAFVVLAFSPMQMFGSLVNMRIYKNSGNKVDEEQKEAYKKSNNLLSEIILNYKTVIGFGEDNVEGIMDVYKQHVILPNKMAVKKAHISGILFGYGQFAKYSIIGFIFWISAIMLKKYNLDPLNVYIAVYTMFLGAMGTGSAFSHVPNVA
jgi:ABC-type multidrug transport system fused ATPase/permease subunit